MDMQILKKWWFWIIVVLILVVFFPKGGYTRGGPNWAWGSSLTDTWLKKDCSCLGFKLQTRTMDGPTFYTCFGFQHSCKCFEGKFNEEGRMEEKEVICK